MNQYSPTTKPYSTEDADRAFKDRPLISIRRRIIFSYLSLFLFVCLMGAILFFFISVFEEKQIFLENTTNISFELQKARRYEKNFFLHGTNLSDALNQISTVYSLVLVSKQELVSFIGRDDFSIMLESLEKYDELLNQLLRSVPHTGGAYKDLMTRLEPQIRKYRIRIQSTVNAAIEKERSGIHNLISSTKIGIFVFLGFFLVLTTYLINMLTQHIIMPINRLIEDMRRIAEGDFSPIAPRKKYRDEFTILVMAMNRMTEEIHVRQEQLVQTRKMAAIGNLTAGIAHELNNPLNNISLITESLLDDSEDYGREECDKMLNSIFEQVERASSTVKNLLDFTRKDQPSFSSLSISEIISSTLSLLGNEIELNDIIVELKVDKNLPPTYGNHRDLQQVFLNLIMNAIHAMPDGGTLIIKAELDQNKSLKINIVDSGTGIPAENLHQIFEPFFTTKEVGKGTGLGLSVSYGIVKNHQGEIDVFSQIGNGTTFSVTLPTSIEPKH